MSIHSSEVDRDTLREILAENAAYEQARVFRSRLLRRLGLIAFVVWVLSWPTHLLPHIALWIMLAIVAAAAFFTSTTPPAMPGTPGSRR